MEKSKTKDSDTPQPTQKEAAAIAEHLIQARLLSVQLGAAGAADLEAERKFFNRLRKEGGG